MGFAHAKLAMRFRCRFRFPRIYSDLWNQKAKWILCKCSLLHYQKLAKLLKNHSYLGREDFKMQHCNMGF